MCVCGGRRAGVVRSRHGCDVTGVMLWGGIGLAVWWGLGKNGACWRASKFAHTWNVSVCESFEYYYLCVLATGGAL